MPGPATEEFHQAGDLDLTKMPGIEAFERESYFTLNDSTLLALQPGSFCVLVFWQQAAAPA